MERRRHPGSNATDLHLVCTCRTCVSHWRIVIRHRRTPNSKRQLPRMGHGHCQGCQVSAPVTAAETSAFVRVVHIVTGRHNGSLLSCSRLSPSRYQLHQTQVKMKFATGSNAGLVAFSALTAIAQAEDSLYSKRMVKRGIDADGNYNICMSACSTPTLLLLT
jgi:hypothetical protein